MGLELHRFQKHAQGPEDHTEGFGGTPSGRRLLQQTRWFGGSFRMLYSVSEPASDAVHFWSLPSLSGAGILDVKTPR